MNARAPTRPHRYIYVYVIRPIHTEARRVNHRTYGPRFAWPHRFGAGQMQIRRKVGGSYGVCPGSGEHPVQDKNKVEKNSGNPGKATRNFPPKCNSQIGWPPSNPCPLPQQPFPFNPLLLQELGFGSCQGNALPHSTLSLQTLSPTGVLVWKLSGQCPSPQPIFNFCELSK